MENKSRINELYVKYYFHSGSNEYQIYLQKQSDKFDIYRKFENGSEGVAHGTYRKLDNDIYNLMVDENSRITNSKLLLIKNDSIHGFNGASHALSK